MTRFGRLEFDDRKMPKIPRQSDGPDVMGEPIRDEHYFFSQALFYWFAGDFELALRNYSRSVECSATFLGGWLGQIQMLTELGEYPESLLWADKALKLFPDHAELLAAKAVAAAYDARMEQAFAYSDRSLERDNVTSYVWLARAQVLLKKKSTIAKTCIGNAVSMAGPNIAYVRLHAGRSLSRAGDYWAALEHLQEAVRLAPKSALAWFELGICQSRLGRSEAKATLEQCLNIHPDWKEAKAELRKCRGRGFLSRIFGR
jgi:tetratricopeptide (TPR) repeat protein